MSKEIVPVRKIDGIKVTILFLCEISMCSVYVYCLHAPPISMLRNILKVAESSTQMLRNRKINASCIAYNPSVHAYYSTAFNYTIIFYPLKLSLSYASSQGALQRSLVPLFLFYR